jgi:NAD(P)-dependent dehydrogenase (short-subunit alcohol dehydrogenase family)
MGRVDGKVVLVTGAATGIGRATCILLAREGATVAVTDVKHEEAHETVRLVREAGGRAEYWALDVTSEDEVEAVFAHVKETFGPIDVLVNNAGVVSSGTPTHDTTLEEFERVQRINMTGVFLCTKHAIPDMLESGRGSIINVSSIAGLVGNAGLSPYNASKGAVRLFTKSTAVEYAPRQIRVNSIHPGAIWTPMVEEVVNRSEDPVAARAGFDALHPLGHIGEPDDIGWAIVYLASEESKFITGAEFVIDGGWTAQ